VPVRLTQIHTKNFRCFPKAIFDLDAPIVVIRGGNGTGKSSLLEALHYLCYLRSFRTHTPRDLVEFGQDGFFLKANFLSGIDDQEIKQELQVGFTNKKRLVRLNQKSISSFQELMEHYRVVTLTVDDLDFIKGGPDVRRQTIDQAILLASPEYVTHLRTYRHILENRNSLLQRGGAVSAESHELWMHQLFEHSRRLQYTRIALIESLAVGVNAMLGQIFNESITISLDYKMQNDALDHDFDGFMKAYSTRGLLAEEKRYGRSLFGAHLDDVIVRFQQQKSKQFASRGQQKLTVLLLKVAQLRAQAGGAVLLLDDFMSDFDHQRAHDLVLFLASLPNQIIFTSPSHGNIFDDIIDGLGAKQLDLTR
jgi:DNA replication and repair protein RecF